MQKDMLQIIERELDHWPDVRWEIEKRSRHHRLHLTYRGQSRFIVCPSSQSDVRSLKNKVTDIRREARTLGAERR